MLVTIAIIVFLASIASFFSQEFTRLFKKIFAIPGVKLILPLFLASFIIIFYEEFGQWLLVRFQIFLHKVVVKLDMILPFKTGFISLGRIISLFIIASVPIWIAEWSAIRKKYQAPHSGTYWLGFVLWIVAAILLTVA